MAKLSWFAFLTGPATELDMDVEPDTIFSKSQNMLTGIPLSLYAKGQENVFSATADQGIGQLDRLRFFTDNLI